jgi:hypothetical protein
MSTELLIGMSNEHFNISFIPCPNNFFTGL